MRSLAPWALVALVCTLGCSRDHPLFDTGDAGADARPGNGNGAVTELVPVRRDAGVLPDLGPAVRDQCVAACEEYAGCGVVVDCSASDAAWVESVCARGCAPWRNSGRRTAGDSSPWSNSARRCAASSRRHSPA